MKICSLKSIMLASMSLMMVACADDPLTEGGDPGGPTPPPISDLAPQPTPDTYPMAKNGDAILGNPDYLAISYGAWRTTTRESGANVPTVDQQKEDMLILNAMGIKVIRTYNTQGFIGLDGKSNTENLLEAIQQLMDEDENFEMYVMLGVWIDALDARTEDVDHTQGSPANDDEIAMAKQLALAYPDIVKVIAVGNEAMVNWATEYYVVPGVILAHVNDLQSWKLEDDSTAGIWITSSDNHAVWGGSDANGNVGEQADLKALINAVDYISLHTYAHHDTLYDPTFAAAWKVPEDEQELSTVEQIDAAMVRAYDHTLSQFQASQAFVNTVDATKPIHLGETGWSTISTENFGEFGTRAADEYKQKSFYDAMRSFTNEFGASLFFFQAFDEPWKGDPNNASHSEKHFGLVDIDGNVKYLAWDKVETLNDLGLTRGDVSAFTQSFDGDTASLMETVFAPNYAPVVAPPEEGEFVVLGSALYEGAAAYGWDNPITAWAGVDDATAVLTVVADPSLAATWGWGAGVGINGQSTNLSSSTQMTFEMRGVNSAESVLAEFSFWVGFQTTGGSGNHWVRFNDGDYTLTEEWQTFTINLSEFGDFAGADLSQVTSPFTIADIYEQSGGSAPTKSNFEVRNISWLD
ncbi:hypothetical protein M0C34_04500 [Agarivorans sp. TSD2052]|uniref:hypothetical protein n=1 Tax=Agarivorans sp. TSD2052 TaxID=2937286 RepID=UPI00200D7147|nr:hypothetical protein [Agarivorans sp. TSD2052]UPW19544.1 hypothetical protein M0C34_04500 [Agarivorans sp. TSD2052]